MVFLLCRNSCPLEYCPYQTNTTLDSLRNFVAFTWILDFRDKAPDDFQKPA